MQIKHTHTAADMQITHKHTHTRGYQTNNIGKFFVLHQILIKFSKYLHIGTYKYKSIHTHSWYIYMQIRILEHIYWGVCTILNSYILRERERERLIHTHHMHVYKLTYKVVQIVHIYVYIHAYSCHYLCQYVYVLLSSWVLFTVENVQSLDSICCSFPLIWRK